MAAGGEQQQGQAAQSKQTTADKPRRRATPRAAKPDGQTLPPQESPEATMVRPEMGNAEKAGAAGGAAGAAAAERPAMERAEELIDRVGDRLSQFIGQARSAAAGEEAAAPVEAGAAEAGERVGRLISQLGLGAMRAAARAREELEDIWAEAQNVRRGERQ